MTPERHEYVEGNIGCPCGYISNGSLDLAHHVKTANENEKHLSGLHEVERNADGSYRCLTCETRDGNAAVESSRERKERDD